MSVSKERICSSESIGMLNESQTECRIVEESRGRSTVRPVRLLRVCISEVGNSMSVSKERTYYYHYYTVSCHNFESQNFKLSVSNPKSKHVAYVSVLSQISNCQGLGRKNKHEVLKTDRIKSLDFRGFDSGRLLILRGGNSHVR